MSMQTHSLSTIGNQLVGALKRHPDRIAFVQGDRSLTYAETLALIGRMQSALAQAGLRHGDRIGFLIGNRAEAWSVAMAAQLSGIVITYLHPLASLEDQLHQISDAQIDALAIDVEKFSKRGEEIAFRTQYLKHLFTLGPSEYGVDLIAACATVGASDPKDLARPDDLAILNYTGGTSGKPKAAVRRHRGQTAMAVAILADFDIPQSPRYLAIAPITHVGGTKILPVLMRGGTVYLQDGFDAGRVIEAIKTHKINMTLMVPTMIYTLLDCAECAEADFSSLELLLYGAAPMSPQRLVEGLERIGPVFSQLYGQAECYPISVLPRSAHDISQPHLFSSCGHPVSSCEVKLLGEDNQEVAVGEMGEVCIRGPHVMEEYLGQPEQSSETLKNGWLRTGDLARFDEQGYLYIVDRKKDMVISGGFNIYTLEVEKTLLEHPAVVTVAVIGIPDSKWGEALSAAVVVRKGTTVNEETLVEFVKKRRGSLMAPKQIVFVEALPLTSLGKPDKKSLRSSALFIQS